MQLLLSLLIQGRVLVGFKMCLYGQRWERHMLWLLSSSTEEDASTILVAVILQVWSVPIAISEPGTLSSLFLKCPAASDGIVVIIVVAAGG